MKSLVFVITLLIAIPSSSQVVNIEKKRMTGEKALQGNLDLSLSIIENNNQIVQGKNDIKIQFNKNKHTVLFFNNLSLSQVNEEKYINDGFQHLRYNYEIVKTPLIFEIFSQHQYNTLKKLKQRYLLGIGPRIRLNDNDTLRLYIGALPMYEYEVLTDDSTKHENLRLSTYFSMSYVFNKILSIDNISYFQPIINDFTSYRVSSESSLKFNISKNLIFKTSFGLTYDSKPPFDVKNLFYNLTNGISFKF